MFNLIRNKKIKILLLLGIIFAIMGMIIHFSCPSEMVTASGDENAFINDLETYDGFFLNTTINDNNYQFRLDITASGYYNNSWNSNFTIIVLNIPEYKRFENGTDIADLNPIERIDKEYDPYMGQPTHRKTILLNNPESVYILLVNNGITPINVGVGYYYSIIHPTYYIGIIIAAFGTMFAFSLGVIYSTKWVRYFLLGISINIIAFFIRVATLPAFFGNPIMYYLTVEMYSDYQTWYMGWSIPFKEGAWLYSGELVAYEYGPLYMLTIEPFSYLPHAWGMGIPLFLFGIGTGWAVYKIMYKLIKDEKKSTIATLIYFLNPFTLLYSSFTWLNPSISTFFVALSFYFLLEKKNTYSLVSLGIATMYKQFALIFFPLIIIYIIKQQSLEDVVNKFKTIIKYALPYCLTILLISLPFLIYDYQAYINRVFLNNALFTPENLNWANYHLGAAVRLTDPIILLGGANVVTLIINYLIAYYILLSASLILIYISLLRFNNKKDVGNSLNKLFIKALYLSIFLIIAIQILYPRGAYKFYLILLAPFISIFYDHKNLSLDNHRDNQSNLRYLIPLVITWGIFFCFRYAYFLILILWIIFLIYNNRKHQSIEADRLL